MADESLMLLAKEVRGKTLRLLEGVDERQARFAAPGLNNSILWHAGHALVVVEHLGIAAMEKKPASLPEGWFETFSWKSDPRTVTRWPAVSDVVAKLQDQLRRLVAGIEGLPEQRLAEVVDPAKNRTLRYMILHGLHDEAGHQGEMWLIKKLFARQTSGG